MSTAHAYRADIDGLRAIAVLSVVVFHAFPTWLPGGFVGVDVFFVISGYLITGIIVAGIERGQFSLADFYSRRIRRIFPALLIVLAATVAIGWKVLLPDELEQLGGHTLAAAAFSSNFILWSEVNYFDAGASTKLLLHLWSLAIEEQFYLVWPLVLMGLARMRQPALVVTIAFAVASLAFCLWLTSADATAAFFSPLSRCWELLVGAGLVLMERRGHLQPLRSWPLSLAGFALLVGSILWLQEGLDFPGWRAALPVLGAAFIIAAGAAAWPNRALALRPFVAVGLISYPLYLWHWPLLVYARLIEGGTPPDWMNAAVVVLAIALATATFLLVERPLQSLPRSWRVPAPLLAGLVLMGSVGLLVAQNEGFATRFPPEARQVASFTYDYREDFRSGTCFLDPEQSFEDFAPCGIDDASGRPRILLWGDSYVAHLYAGYQDRLGADHTIVQRTASACPPIMGIDVPDRPHCRHINDEVFALAVEGQFERVVLSTAWYLLNWREIAGTIDALKAGGVQNIDVVGPVPLWSEGLPRQIMLDYARTGQMPDRLSRGLSGTMWATDPAMRELVEAHGARYLSAAEALCDAHGCLTMADPGDPSTIMAYDTGHLTRAGSIALVRNLVN